MTAHSPLLFLRQRLSLVTCGTAALLALSGCSKDESSAKAGAAKSAVPAEPTTPKVTEAVVDAEQQAKEQKVTDAIAAMKIAVATEQERWTEELEASTQTLADTTFPNAEKAIAASLAGTHRMPGNADRDSQRHPQETLLFMGFNPSSRVAEMGIGSGWYTEIMAPVVAAKGLLMAGVADPEGPMDSMSTVYGLRQQALLSKSPALYGKVATFQLGGDKVPQIGEPGSVDLVLAIREMHNWQRRGAMDNNLQAIAAVLAPGGHFGVVQHRAKPDAVVEESAEQGYLPQAWVIEKVEAAGFKLVKESEINANSKDTKDYTDGVWTLPPNLRTEASPVEQEKYKAIGESDRMTLLFERI